MTKPLEIPEAIFYLRPHFLLLSLPPPPQCHLEWKVIPSQRALETPPALPCLGCCVVRGDAGTKIKYSRPRHLRSEHHSGPVRGDCAALPAAFMRQQPSWGSQAMATYRSVISGPTQVHS